MTTQYYHMYFLRLNDKVNITGDSFSEIRFKRAGLLDKVGTVVGLDDEIALVQVDGREDLPPFSLLAQEYEPVHYHEISRAAWNDLQKLKKEDTDGTQETA